MSIGLPVYNEEQLLERALKSLLAQEYQNWELIICDNASTDRTLEIAQGYARKDARIQVHTAPENRGSAWNFNRAFHLSRGKYFMWAAADDQWHPTFISRCVEALEADPKVVLAYPRAVLVDDDGKEYGFRGHLDTRAFYSPTERFLVQTICLDGYTAIYGVIRRDALRRTKLMRYTAGLDYVLLGELSLYGPFANIPDVLFSFRRIRRGEPFEKRKLRQLQDISGGRSMQFPYLRMLLAYLNVAWNAPASLWKKVLLSAAAATILGLRLRGLLVRL